MLFAVSTELLAEALGFEILKSVQRGWSLLLVYRLVTSETRQEIKHYIVFCCPLCILPPEAFTSPCLMGGPAPTSRAPFKLEMFFQGGIIEYY